MSVTKRKREKPCKPRGVSSKGTARMSKHPLDEISKVNLGKGLFRSFRPIGTVKH